MDGNDEGLKNCVDGIDFGNCSRREDAKTAMNREKTLSVIGEFSSSLAGVGTKMVRSRINSELWERSTEMRFHDLLRFGANHPKEIGVPVDPAIQILGDDNMADKLTSLQAAESQPPKQQAAPEDANATEAEKIAAAVDLAISLEDG